MRIKNVNYKGFSCSRPANEKLPACIATVCVGREGTTRQGINFNTFNAFHEQGYTQPLSINKTKQWRKQRALYRQAKHLKGKIGVQSTVTN